QPCPALLARARPQRRPGVAAGGAAGGGMSPLAAPFSAGCVLLVLSGVVKLRRPSATAAALAGARLPSRPLVVRAWALAEWGVGTWALVTRGEAGPAVVAVTYLFLAVFVARAVRAQSR